MKNGKLAAAIGISVAVAAVIMVGVIETAGGSIDVIGKKSVASFETLLNALPDQIQSDEADAGWSLEAPDGSARFIWSWDYEKSPLDVMAEFDAQPFINAGLDTTKLPDNYSVDNGKITVGSDLGSKAVTYDGAADPLASYEELVKDYRSSINYHTAMDHFGVKLGDGNMVEWARDMETNKTSGEAQDKDLVFALNPEPLLNAGVDPEKVEGWAYATVSVEEDGKMVDVYRFLKPFNIK